MSYFDYIVFGFVIILVLGVMELVTGISLGPIPIFGGI
jgi:hypothetical protein